MLAVRSELPAGHEPVLGPIATGLGEIFMFTVDAAPGATNGDGSEVTPTDLRTVHDWIIRPQLLRVPGVIEVNPIGGYRKEILIAPDPARLLAHGLSNADILRAVEANNGNRGAGYIEHNGAQWLMRVPGQAQTVADLGDILVKQSGGVPLRIRDVATVEIGKELRSGAATQNGREVVMSTVFMLVGENSREVAQRVADKLEAIKATLPEGVAPDWSRNRSRRLRRICSKARCWSSWFCSCCSGTCAPRCSRPRSFHWPCS
jgi:cobalt-zinc-cadmium resistance protein CzcA